MSIETAIETAGFTKEPPGDIIFFLKKGESE